MTTRSDLDRSLAEWFQADAGVAMPDYLDEIVDRVSRESQRRWWSSPERWLPVDLTTRASSLAFPRLGRLLLVGLLIIALGALVVFAVGSRTPRVPPPFGPAANGDIAYDSTGDIYLVDPDGSNVRKVIGGPTNDLAPFHSRDGTQFVFWRVPTAGQNQLMIAQADGSNVRQLTESLLNADWFEWSPRGDQLAVVRTEVGTGKRVLSIVDPAGQAPIRTLDLPFSVDNNVYWLPPDGAELVLSGRPDPDELGGGGLYAVRPDGTGLRTIAPVRDGEHPYFDLALASDGTSLLYTTIESDDSDNGIGWHIHHRDLATGADRPITFDATSTDEHGPVLSPDATKVVLWTESLTGGVEAGDAQVVLAPADGSSLGRALGSKFPIGTAIGYGFSPDGSSVILSFNGGRTYLFDVDTGQSTATLASIPNYASWQRKAP